ncbi:MAG: hypothetical protein JSS69_01470 [Acidobacteria bacterium]|nr:hypothetical protein [Acidobacteriota bacterium]MBS1864563.1 hypothetical protein [Acidobacteriota bacterium]
MLPALRRFVLILSVCFLFHYAAPSAFAQSPSRMLPSRGIALRAVSDSFMDPSGDELKRLGQPGQAIEQARNEVFSVLLAENSCSAWFRGAEPYAADKFRSLRFSIDPLGNPEILKVATFNETQGYYEPYVASTGQNVGWGSTIVLNSNGAFFKDSAHVTVVTSLSGIGYQGSFKGLSVGGFRGATLSARMLALLHELGHVLNLLPAESAGRSGAQLSSRNTVLVLNHCSAEIKAADKRVRELKKTSSSKEILFSPPAETVRRGRSAQ